MAILEWPKDIGPLGLGAKRITTFPFFAFVRLGIVTTSFIFFFSGILKDFSLFCCSSKDKELTSFTTSLTSFDISFIFSFNLGSSCNTFPMTAPGLAFPLNWTALFRACFRIISFIVLGNIFLILNVFISILIFLDIFLDLYILCPYLIYKELLCGVYPLSK